MNGLCMNHVLRFTGMRSSAIHTFYYLLYKLIVKEELRDGRDGLMYFFTQVIVSCTIFDISVQTDNVSIRYITVARLCRFYCTICFSSLY